MKTFTMRRSLPVVLVFLLLGGFVLIPSMVSAISITVLVENVEGAGNTEVDIPILIVGGEEVGALRVDLTYDAEILEPVSVSQGDLTSTALVDFNPDEPGRLVMGFVTLDNVAGDGSVMVAHFRVIGSNGQSTALGLENARAWEGDETRFDIDVTTASGQFTVVDSSSFPWLWIIIALILLFLLLLLLLILIIRKARKSKQRKQPAAAAPVAQPATAGGTRFCTNCGAPATAGTRFCSSCGQALPG